MITADKVDKVVERFESLKDADNIRLNMSTVYAEDYIETSRFLPFLPKRRTHCGTVCCHIGAYILAKDGAESVEQSRFDRMKDVLAEDLGFEYSADLIDYMSSDTHIWGNDRAYDMFISSYAFECPPSTITLQHIIDHWKGVADRLREQEAA